jgi:hypothetical protein
MARISYLSAAILLIGCMVVGRAQSPTASKQVTIRLHHSAPGGSPGTTVDVVGLDQTALAPLAKANLKPDQWAPLFAVYVDSGSGADAKNRPPVTGSYRIVDDTLRFEPRFPLERGVRYRAVFDPRRLPGSAGAAAKPIVAELLLPKPKSAPSTVVQHVYPTSNQLPENQLKFYLHFSAAMSRGEAYRHIHLLDAAGKQVELPFLELDEELWDRDGKRFTLFFDPGRIKRGLKPREEVGPALEEGKRYTLVIDRQWSDAAGNPLKETYRKAFRVGAPIDLALDPKTWRLSAPPANTKEPVDVRFPRPMDHALLHRLLWVTDPAGRKLGGTITVTEDETRWRLTPTEPWSPGRYALVADTALEDLAGNRIGRPFEVDVFRPVQRTVQSQTVQIPFTIANPSPPR